MLPGKSLEWTWALVDGVCVGTNETCMALALENESHYHYLAKRFLSKLRDSSARTLITLLGWINHSVNDLSLTCFERWRI
jgi:hypothetical protein